MDMKRSHIENVRVFSSVSSFVAFIVLMILLAVRGVSLKVEPGEIVDLPVGCAKIKIMRAALSRAGRLNQ